MLKPLLACMYTLTKISVNPLQSLRDHTVVCMSVFSSRTDRSLFNPNNVFRVQISQEISKTGLI